MRAAASLLLLLGRLRASLSRGGGGPADGSGRAGDPAVRNRRARRRRAGRSGQTSPNTRSPPPPTTSCRTCRATIGSVWTQYSMLVRFFSERTGGVKFFQELDRAKQNPAVNLGLLELMHACLSLGFRGRLSRDGRRRARCRACAAISTRRSGATGRRRSRTFRRIGAARRSRSPAAAFRFPSGASPRSRWRCCSASISSCAAC